MTCFNSLQGKYLICCWPKSATSDKTWGDLLRVICWSLCALQKVLHPSHDHTAAPLKKGSPFFEQKRKPLANGYRGCIWAIMGDAEFAAIRLQLPHWASSHPWESGSRTLKLTPRNLKGLAMQMLWPTHAAATRVVDQVCERRCLAHGRQATPPQERLSVIWQAVQKAYKDPNTSTRLSNLISG